MGKKGLILAGGGTRGSYQAGALKVLEKHQFKPEVVTGTSIGAINGCMVAQGDLELLYDLWDHVQVTDFIAEGQLLENLTLERILDEKNTAIDFVKKYFDKKGMNVEPLKKMLRERIYSKEKLAKSPIEYGCMTVHYPNLKPRPVYKEEMLAHDYGADFVLASASCFPAFPVCNLEKEDYVDGGYYDNCPIDMALDMGVTEGVIVDLDYPSQHPEYLDVPAFTYIYPHMDMGSFLDFNPSVLKRNYTLGFNDTGKAMGDYEGIRYTFHPFAQPAFFDEVVFRIAILDEKIKRVTKVFDTRYVVGQIVKASGLPNMNVKRINLGLLDQLMGVMNADETEVYDFDKVCEHIENEFKEAYDPNYPILPSNLSEAAAFLKTLDTKGIILRLLAQKAQNNVVVDERITLPIYPMEEAMAQWIWIMHQARGK